MGLKEMGVVEGEDFSAAGRRRDEEFRDRFIDRRTEIQNLSEQWDTLLSLFGTDTARQKFLNLCQEYKKELVKAKGAATIEDKGGRLTSSDSKKAVLHNEIMHIIQSLYLAKGWPKEKERLLQRLQNRRIMEELINQRVQYRK